MRSGRQYCTKTYAEELRRALCVVEATFRPESLRRSR